VRVTVAATPTQDEFLVDRLLAATGGPAEVERAGEVLASVARHVYGDGRTASSKPTSPREWGDLALAAVPEGMRRLVLRRLAGKLLSLGVDGELALALLHSWNLVHARPPLPPEEVEHQVRLIARLQAQEIERNGR
jgi:hypothetical protein